MRSSSWIDFWTTNSAIWFHNGEDIEMTRLRGWGETTDRTSIFYSFEENGKPYIWEEGLAMHIIDGEEWRLITSPKSFLSATQLPKIQVLRKRLDLIDVISDIVKDFKNKLEKQAWASIESIVVWRPVYFHDSDEKQDRVAQDRLEEAFRRWGFKHIEFEHEPLAAFYAFKRKNTESLSGKKKVLVVDLGWWTSDFSIINTGWNFDEVVWSSGVYVWGDNFDQRLVTQHFWNFLGKSAEQKLMNGWTTNIPNNIYTWLADKSRLVFFKRKQQKLIQGLIPLIVWESSQVSFWRIVEILDDISLWYFFHQELEEIKKELSSRQSSWRSFDMFRVPFFSEVARWDFEVYIQQELEKIRSAIIEVLTQAGVSPDDIDWVILNWWSSKIPIIQEIVSSIVGDWKLLKWNSLSSVW